MKVKVGDVVYSSNEMPIMVILTEDDKNNISNMLPEATRYAAFPDGHFKNQDVAIGWMLDD